jgi:hypothetical protein
VAVSKKKRAFGGECPNYAACTHRDATWLSRSAGSHTISCAASSRPCPEKVTPSSILYFFFRPKRERRRRLFFFYYFDDETRGEGLACPRERTRALNDPNAQSRVSVWGIDPILVLFRQTKEALFPPAHTPPTLLWAVSLYSGTRLFAPSSRSSVFIYHIV